MHTRRLSRAIFLGVALFVAIVAAVLVARGRAVRIQSPDLAASKADYRIKEVHLSEESRRGVRWQLDAAQAETYEELGKTILTKVTVRIEEPGRTWTLTSDAGELVQATKDVELRGNVVLASSDGLRVETTRLRWAADEQRAWSDAPVTVSRLGAVVRGQGIEARVGQESASIKGRVHATFSASRRSPEPKAAGPGGKP